MSRTAPRSEVYLARRLGFTLVELILMMALMTVAMAIVAPQLAGFIRGRNAQEEGRRLLALTRYGADEAVSRGERFELWLSPQDGKYGLRLEPGVEDDDAPVKQYQCAEGLSLGLSKETLGKDNQAQVIFWPDGTIDAGSPQRIELLEKNVVVRALNLETNRLGYKLEVVTP